MSRVLALMLAGAMIFGLNPDPVSAQGHCTFWISPTGSDSASGSRERPWATLGHATSAMPDQGCILMLANGSYAGEQEIERRFTQPVVIRAETPYGARLTHDNTVLHINGAAQVTIEGLEITHSGPGSEGYLVLIDESDGVGASRVTVRNNIIHDSFDNDLLKAHNRSVDTRIIQNLFYNQGPSEQHLDINSTERTTIARNVFFNEYAASGRSIESNAKHFIVVKDSNEGADGLLGSRDTTIRDNVFAHWEAGKETFIRVGNDGKPYHEAVGVDIFSNLILGDSNRQVGTVLGISGADDVSFFNNTVVGDLPSDSYAMRITTKGGNPSNRDLHFANNIWSDPTGTMEDFSSGDPGTVSGLELHNNLYWNGSVRVPGGDVADPHDDDPRAIFANPGLPPATLSDPLPSWDGSEFADGSRSILVAWTRLVDSHAALAPGATPLDRADPAFAPATDIRGVPRGATPSLGAWDPGYPGYFADAEGSTFEGDIEWLGSVGVTKGCNPPANSLFCPEDVVTRGQMAAFLHRALEGILEP
jgi:hypothetical protein